MAAGAPTSNCSFAARATSTSDGLRKATRARAAKAHAEAMDDGAAKHEQASIPPHSMPIPGWIGRTLTVRLPGADERDHEQRR